MGQVIEFSRPTPQPVSQGETYKSSTWSLDVVSTAGGNSLIEACVPAEIVDSLLLLMRHKAIVLKKEDGTLHLVSGST